jgi:hypothetical protein
MKAKRNEKQRRSDGFGDVIVNASVRALFHELIEILSNLHGDVVRHCCPVDVRAEFDGRTICRIVPYRELIHLQIGDAPVWEVRIRDEAGYLEAVDRILVVFLSMAAASSSPGHPRRFGSAAQR